MISGVKRYEARRRWSVEALVWTGENIQALQEFVGRERAFLSTALNLKGEPMHVLLTAHPTQLEGIELEPGMVVLRSVTGRVSVYSATEFADQYVPVPEEA